MDQESLFSFAGELLRSEELKEAAEHYHLGLTSAKEKNLKETDHSMRHTALELFHQEELH